MIGLILTIITDVQQKDIFANHSFCAFGDSESIVFTEVDGIYFIAGNDNTAYKPTRP